MTPLEQAIRNLPPTYPGLNQVNPLIVFLMGCRKFYQFCCTFRAIEDPETFCPFCPAELARRNRVPIETHGRMLCLANEFPRPDVQGMALIVPKYHATASRQLHQQDVLDAWELQLRCEEKHGFPSGAAVLRYGDPRDHAGTIQHLHWNVVRPTREGGMSAPFAKLVGGEYGHDAYYRRLLSFLQRIEDRGGTEWLFSQAGILETQPPMMK